MSLTQPWWLLLALLAGLLVYLHRQRRAARAVEVAGLHLWQRVAARHAPRSSPRARLSAALLLQLLVLLLVALALARPTLGPSATPGGTLLLIEAGRAMRATDVRPDRYAFAAQQAASRLSGAVTVVQVGASPRPLAVRRPDLGAVRAALLASRADDGPPDWPAAARQARALLAGTPATVIAYVSPSQAQAARAALQALNADVRVVGRAFQNAAITALSVTPGEQGAPWSLKGAARVYGPAETRPLTVTLDGRRLHTQALSLTPGVDVPFTLRFTPGAGGVLRAALDATDALPADDAAQLRLSPTPATLNVTLVTDGNARADDPIARGLAALPSATVTRTDTLPTGQSAADLLVIARPGVPPPAQPLAAVTLWVNALATAARPDAPLSWNRQDPLSTGVDWPSLRVPASVPAVPWPDGHALLGGGRGPLVEVRRPAGRAEVRVNFPLAQSSWTQQPAFPVFLANLAALARPRTGERVSACTAGLPCALPVAAAVLRDPDGQDLRRPGPSFTPARAGVYAVDGVPLAVNRLAGPDSDQTATDTGGPTDAPRRTGTPFTLAGWVAAAWRPLLAVAWAALLVELALAIRAEPRLRRARWGQVPGPLRRMLALHLGAAVALSLALLDVPLPGPRPAATEARVLPPGTPRPAGFTGPVVWGGPSPSLAPQPAGTATGDLAFALRAAVAALPGREGRTVRVSGDAWPASADLPDTVAWLRAQGVAVSVDPGGTPPAVSVTAFDLPDGLHAGQPFAAHVAVTAQAATAAQLTVRRGDTTLLTQNLTLPAGPTRLALPLREDTPGAAGYTLTLTTASGVLTARAGMTVHPDGGVLLVSPDAGVRTAVARALRVQGVRSRGVTPAVLNAAALAPGGLAGVESVALLDVPSVALSADARAGLDDLVRAGGHLFLGGGAQAFGPGGYVGTALETLSPLSGRVSRDVPRLGLALVLDKSGSMNEVVGADVTKLDLIKSAALNSALLLSDASDVTVIAFDSSPKIAVPLTAARNRDTVRAQISRIEAEGGTVVKRAIEAALKELSRSSASQRHIILLTDGIDGGIFSPDEYQRLIGRIRATGITVSTVSVGAGMHIPLMRSIAQWGGGRFSLTQDWRDVPALLAQDTLDQGPSAVKTGRFPVRWAGLDATPTLQGYVQTTLKPGATLLASVGRGRDVDPLAATWRVGLGSVSALATPPVGTWAANLSRAADYPARLVPLLRGEPGASPAGPPTLTRRGADLAVTAAQAQVTLLGPASPTPLTLTPDGTGRFEGLVLAPPPGGYVITTAQGQAAAGVLPAPPDPTVLREVAAQTTRPAGPDGVHWQGGWPVWALLGLLAFLAGLIQRYWPDTSGATRRTPNPTAAPQG